MKFKLMAVVLGVLLLGIIGFASYTPAGDANLRNVYGIYNATNINITNGTLIIGNGSAAGYVLTSDSAGRAYWAVSTGGSGSSVNISTATCAGSNAFFYSFNNGTGAWGCRDVTPIYNLPGENITSGTIPNARINTTYLSTLYYAISNPQAFVNASVTTLTNFYNKTDIDTKAYINASVVTMTNFYNKSDTAGGSYISGNFSNLSINNTWIQAFNDSSIVTAVNNSCAKLSGISATNLTSDTLPNARLNNTYMQLFNETAINTSNNIESLGFNTTAHLNNVYALINHGHATISANNVSTGTLPNGVLNNTYMQLFNDTTAISAKLDATDQRYNDTTLIGTVNTSVNNLNSSMITTLNKSFTTQCSGTDQMYNVTFNPFTGTITSLCSSQGTATGGLVSGGIYLYNTSSQMFFNDTQGNATYVNENQNSGGTYISGNFSNLSINDALIQSLNSSSNVTAVNNSCAKLSGISATNLTSDTLPNARLNDTYMQLFNETSTAPWIIKTGKDFAYNTTQGTATYALINHGHSTISAANVSTGTLPNGVLNDTYMQLFNQTTLANNINTSANIEGLGFNTTAHLNNVYALINHGHATISANNVSTGTLPNGVLNDTYMQMFNQTSNVTLVNNSCAKLSGISATNITSDTLSNARLNDTYMQLFNETSTAPWIIKTGKDFAYNTTQGSATYAASSHNQAASTITGGTMPNNYTITGNLTMTGNITVGTMVLYANGTLCMNVTLGCQWYNATLGATIYK